MEFNMRYFFRCILSICVLVLSFGCTSNAVATKDKIILPKTLNIYLAHPEISQYASYFYESFKRKGFNIGQTDDPRAGKIYIGFNPDLFNTTITVSLKDSRDRDIVISEVSNKGWGTGIARGSAISKLAQETVANLDKTLSQLDLTIVADNNVKIDSTDSKSIKSQIGNDSLATDDLSKLLSTLKTKNVSPNFYVFAVGIENYLDVSKVPFANTTATRFADLFGLLGVPKENIILLTDADATNGRIRGRLKTLLNRLDKKDKIFVYFAGHGLPSKDGRSSYLLAYDGGPGSFEEPELELAGLYNQISKSRVGNATLFIDACFSGRTSKNSLLFDGVAPVSIAKTKDFDPNERITVITAGKGDQFANQFQSKGQRLFGYFLVKSIAESRGITTAQSIYTSVRANVLKESRALGIEFEQEPELLGNTSSTVIE